MKLYEVDFKPKYPVSSGLIILAENKEECLKLAKEVVLHTDVKIEDIEEVNMDKSKIVFYESGDY